MVPLSVLDLSPIVEGGDAGQALRNSLDLARHVEALGYRRYWMAEHHNLPGIASAATAVALAHVGAGTERILIGAGGIMLPNHAPLMVAEQFGTLAALHPGRVELGLGRAPGSDQLTLRAMRRNLLADVDQFPQDVLELMAYFQSPQTGQRLQAVPGAGLKVPIWILGSSTFGAQLAAILGLPFAFASHFAPGMLKQATTIYRQRFQPSEQLQTSYLMCGATVVAADSDAEARYLFSSLQQSSLNNRLGQPGRVPPPVADFEEQLDPMARTILADILSHAVVGGPETVRRGLEDFIRLTAADELMVTANIFDHDKRKRSFEIVAEIRDAMSREREMPEIGDAKGKYHGLAYQDDKALAAWLAKRPTEAALEPDLPIIDPHHHFWDTPQRGCYLLPELLADIAGGPSGGHNIVATVFLECRSMYRKDGPPEMAPVGEVEFVNGIAAMSASGGYGPCRVAEAIVGHADLTLGARVREVLEAEIAAGGGRFRGIRHGVSWDPNDAVAKYASRYVPPHQVMDAKFREGFAQLAPLGLSFESWQYHPQLADAADLARAFPETAIILNHVGGVLGVGPYAGRRQEILAGWKKDIAELAKCPNVNVKLGGIGMTSFGFDFPERDVPPSSEDLAAAWRQYVEPCIEAFGVNRCMFESNFPPDKQSGGYTELWNAFKRITASASAAEKRALYSGTAARVYRLTAP